MQAHGNGALGLMLTVGSNLIAIVTLPFLLRGVFSQQRITLDSVELLVELIITILVPLIIGKTVREAVPAVKRFVKNNYNIVSMISNGSYIAIVWQTVSLSRVRPLSALRTCCCCCSSSIYSLSSVGSCCDCSVLHALRAACRGLSWCRTRLSGRHSSSLSSSL